MPAVLSSGRVLAAVLCAAGMLNSCARYTELPLDRTAAPHRSTAALVHARAVPQPPYTIAAVSLLAVQNNPDLVAARSTLGVARAQVVQAGVLPNPELTASVTPVLAGQGIATGWVAGIGQDVKSLVTLSARRAAAQAAEAQVNASLLWHEWQVIGKARLLAVQIIETGRQLAILRRAHELLAKRYAFTSSALAQGNATLKSVSPDLAALSATRDRIDALTRIQQGKRHALNALIGLAPDIRLPLSPAIDLPPLDPAGVEQMLLHLADRRPDFIALQLGYASQDARLRAEILAQFPALAIGLTGGSDTSNILTLGPQVTIDLPVFNLNQGAIAIARATRRKLHDEFSARLAKARGRAQAMLADMSLLEGQLREQRRQLSDIERVTRAAAMAFRAGNLTERTYVDLVEARFDKQEHLLGQEQSLLELQAALETLVGAGMPDARIDAMRVPAS